MQEPDHTYNLFYQSLEMEPDDWARREILADFLEDHSGATINSIKCSILAAGQRWQVLNRKYPDFDPIYQNPWLWIARPSTDSGRYDNRDLWDYLGLRWNLFYAMDPNAERGDYKFMRFSSLWEAEQCLAVGLHQLNG